MTLLKIPEFLFQLSLYSSECESTSTNWKLLYFPCIFKLHVPIIMFYFPVSVSVCVYLFVLMFNLNSTWGKLKVKSLFQVFYDDLNW